MVLRLVVCLLPSPTSTSDLQPGLNKVDHVEYEMSVDTKKSGVRANVRGFSNFLTARIFSCVCCGVGAWKGA